MFNVKSFKDWKESYNDYSLEKKEEIEEYLNKKYGKKFNVYSFLSCNGVVYSDKWGVMSPDMQRFTVSAELSGKERSQSYSDNYHSILLKQPFADKVRIALSKWFESFNFNLEINSKSDADDFTIHAKLFVTLGKQREYELYDKIKIFLSELYKSGIKIWSKWSYSDLSLKKVVIYYLDNDGKLLRKICGNEENIDIHPLNLDELEWLASIVYLDEIVQYNELSFSSCNLGEVITYIKDFVFPLKPANTTFPIELTKGQWINIFEKIVNNPLVSSLKITKIIDVNELNHLEYPEIYIGHRAVCFTDAEGNGYAVFRGTCGDLEWYDNAVGTVTSDTKQQQAAANFLREIRGDKANPVKTLTAVGHSKGGNKAQYGFITTEDGLVNRCVSLDGQGFSNEFIAKYIDKIRAKRDKMELNAERRDFVNSFCNWIGDTTYYSGWRGQSAPGLKYGYSLPFFHFPDALYDWNGKFDNYGKTGAVPALVNQFMLYVLNENKYSGIKETTILSMVSLMMVDRKTTNKQVAEALLNITVIISDMISNDKSFRSKIINVFKEEENMLLATFEMIDSESSQDNELKLGIPIIIFYIEDLALRFFRDGDFRHNILTSLKFLSLSFLDATGGKVSEYIEKFIGKIIVGLSKKSVHYSADKSLNKRIGEIKKLFDEWRFSKIDQKSSISRENIKTFAEYLD
ncbi:MAG: DUF2974 domain-containing protein [Eubacterium sp.]|jgi:hypothetical protein|nr:DUF2974 domain-containing protein [Eubacterium sp.]